MADLNEHNARDLFRAGLSAEAPRPPRVDVAAAVRDGRRRRSARRAALVSGIAVAVAVVVAVPAALALTRDESAPPGQDPPAPATGVSRGPQPKRSVAAPPPYAEPPTSCNVHELPSPSSGGEPTLVTAGSPDGKVHFGRLLLPGNEMRVVRWRAGQPATVAVQGSQPKVNAVNNDGDAVGSSIIGDKLAAWLLRDDDEVVLLPGGDNAIANAINGDGVVAGTRGGRPVVWRNTATAPVELPLPAGARSGQGRTMDDFGNVLGSIVVGQQEWPYVWASDGTGRQLPLPAGTSTSPSGDGRPGPSSVVYYARAGWATGLVGMPSAAAKPVLWNLMTNTVEVLAGVDPPAGPVNGMGFVIGGTADGRAVLLAGDQRIVLPAILGPSKERPNSAAALSDDGRTIAGQAWKTDNDSQAVVWNCH
ncbi:hypothetical protein ABT369_40120 [Dactylosporangium sp. NPDC000244]|uniref:hypothetical protein n=1 Tax=Dactylosporangium sp. NPDC000244 TaxID=3154365 RepID=UPI00332D0FB5